MPYFSGPNGIREVADPGERFTQAFKESRLARLYGDYFKTGNADLGQLARFDPEGAAKIKAEQERTGLAALLGNIYEAPDDQRQSLIAEAFRKDPTLGMNAAKMFDPRFNKTQAEQFTLTPGSARYGPDGKLIVSQPYEAKPQAATFQKDAEGNGWWLRPGEAPIPADAASMPDSGASAGLDQPGYGAADFSDPNSFYAAIGNAIAPHNGRITSTTGGQHNPGSLHPGGGAVDVGMGRETPEQQAAILAALQKDPRWLVRDERTRPQGQAVWGGPHLHVERRGGGGGGTGRRINFGKAETAEKSYRTLSPQEVKGLGLPQGTVAQMSPSGQVQIVNKPRDLPAGGQVIENDDGTTTFIPAGKITEGERNAAGFYARMVAANAEMKKLVDAGYDPGNLRDYLTAGTVLGNYATSDKGQQYHQAAMNWVRANLRKESGAAIGADEARQEIRNYFPQPGDSPGTIAQKARNRETVERAMRTAAGGALPPPKSASAGKRPPSGSPKAGRSVVRTGTQNGRKVVQYSDGSIDYAD